MRISLVTVVLALSCAVAQAASPEQSYLAARDNHIKRINAKKLSEAESKRIAAQEQAALADLQKLLVKIVGPAPKGFKPEGKINMEGLLKGDMGFGILDGLVFTADDEKGNVTVTTEPLLKAWL